MALLSSFLFLCTLTVGLPLHLSQLLTQVRHDPVEVRREVLVGDEARHLEEGLLLLEKARRDKELVLERVVDLAELLLANLVLSALNILYKVVQFAAFFESVAQDFRN